MDADLRSSGLPAVRGKRSRAHINVEDPNADLDVPPPYQVRSVDMLYAAGVLPEAAVRALLPPSLEAAPGNICVIALYDAPEGWSIAPFTCFYAGICVAGHTAPDGSEGMFLVAGTYSGKCGRIFKRDSNDLFDIGTPLYERDGDRVRASAQFGGGASITMEGERLSVSPLVEQGAHRYLGQTGDGLLTHWPLSYVVYSTQVQLAKLEINVPVGHRLAPLAEFAPAWAKNTRDAIFTFGQPEVIGGVNASLTTGGWSTGELQGALMDMLGRIGRPVAVVTRTGRVAYANREAQALLLPSVLDRPMDARSRSSGLHAALGKAIDRRADTPGRAIVVERPDGSPILAQVMPIHRAAASEPAALVLLADPTRPGPNDPTETLQLLGLTPSEARLARLVGQGHAPARAAEILTIASSTARSMLRTIYGKLEIGRQAELAGIVTRLESL